MNNVTTQQKDAFIALAEKYDKNVSEILRRGLGNEIVINSISEAQALETFADRICALVLNDHPDYNGQDEDIHSDAALVANIIPRLVFEFNKTRNPN